MTFRTADTSQKRHSLQNFADTALKAAARFSFLAAARKHEPIACTLDSLTREREEQV